ncbi:MAG: hypothetical protein AAB791_01905 [Patescibacteria group bacterium]
MEKEQSQLVSRRDAVRTRRCLYREWRKAHKAQVGEVKKLTPTLAKEIMAAGGPTFRTLAGNKCRCNQTGAVMPSSKTETHRRRIGGMAMAGQEVPKGMDAKAKSEAEEITVTLFKGVVICPKCGKENFVCNAGKISCNSCPETLTVILPIEYISSYQTRGRVFCPHCSANNVKEVGEVRCDSCQYPFKVKSR